VKNNKKLHFEKASKKQIVIIGSSLLVIGLVITAGLNIATLNRSKSITQVFGAQAKNSLVELKVISWNESQSTTSSATKRVSVSTKLTNVQTSDLQVSPGLQFSVLDKLGQSYPYTATYITVDSSIGGPVAPSQSSTYSLDFEVPKSAEIQKLKFQTDSNSQPVFVRL
jgi:hypothetical protein